MNSSGSVYSDHSNNMVIDIWHGGLTRFIKCLVDQFWDRETFKNFIIRVQMKWREKNLLLEEKVIWAGEEISHSKYDDMQCICRETVSKDAFEDKNIGDNSHL